MDLSILIPARNEMFLAKTIENILENIEGKTEIIVVCDGNWPDPEVKDDPRVVLMYYSKSIGQRAATNEAARLSRSKFIMKVDAHCAFDKGFDVKLMADCGYTDTLVPLMYNLHAFDWVCKCGHRQYQGPTPEKCGKCGEKMEREMIWKPRPHTSNAFMRFDKELHFQYWHEYKERVSKKDELVETMSLLGACWFMHRQRYWDIDGCDESHGSWGQMGTEIACKTWLSGGRLLTDKKTWFAHMFRTQGGDFGFPYPNPGVKAARKRSQELWLQDKWPKAKYKLSWLIDKFAPVPEWSNEKKEEPVPKTVKKLTKGMVYFTDNRLDERIFHAVHKNLSQCCNGHKIVSVSLKPTELGENITLELTRGVLTMFKQILAGVERVGTDIVFLVEHDCLYPACHFDFTPEKKDLFYYNENWWKVRTSDGQALQFRAKQVSGICGYTDLFIEHYRKRVERVEKEGFIMRMGYEPGTYSPPRGFDNYKYNTWVSEKPYIDIRHDNCATPTRFRPDQYRHQVVNWKMSDEVPGWGKTKGRFWEFLNDAIQTP